MKADAWVRVTFSLVGGKDARGHRCRDLVRGGTPAHPAPPPVIRVVVSNDRDIANVDPISISTPADYAVAHLVYSSLVRIKPGTRQLEPDLAEKWEVSSDGLTYTFHLRRVAGWAMSPVLGYARHRPLARVTGGRH